MRMRPLALTGAAILAAAPALAAAGWSTPVRLSAPDRAGYLAATPAQVDGEGAVTAWIRRPAGGGSGSGRVQVAYRRARGAAWSRPLTLSGPGATRLAAAAGERGAGAVAWVRGGRLEGAQRARTADPWRPAPIGTAGGDVTGLAVAVTRSGGATVIWSERRDDRYLVRVAGRAPRAGSWTVRPPRLSVPGPDPPALAVGRGSGALAAWVEDDRVRASRTTDGAFEAPVPVSSDPAARPAVALSPSGAAIIAWSVRLPGGTSVLMASAREPSGRWRAAEDVGIGSAPTVAVNDRGDAVVAWSQGAGDGPQSIESATRRGRGAWHASTVVARRGCGCALRIGTTALDARGLATVAWRRDGGGSAAAGLAALDPGGGGWQRVAPSRRRTETPPGVAAGRGEVVAAWAEAGAAGGVFAISLLAAHAATESPSRLDSPAALDSIRAGPGPRGGR